MAKSKKTGKSTVTGKVEKKSKESLIIKKLRDELREARQENRALKKEMSDEREERRQDETRRASEFLNTTKTHLEQFVEMRTIYDNFLERSEDRVKSFAESLNLAVEAVRDLTRFLDAQDWERLQQTARDFANQVGRRTLQLKEIKDSFENFKRNNQEGEEALPDQEPVPNASACQICLTEFSERRGRIPRVLRCGHSLCEKCIRKMEGGIGIECPFDRKKTAMPIGYPSCLPKNFTVIEMINQKVREEKEKEKTNESMTE